MKLNEFKHSKKVKIDEVDTSSLFGNYGSAALRTGVKSLFGKSTLSTQDQIAKDQFVKTFASKAATGLQDAIQSGWVAPGSVSTQPSPTPAANPNVNTAEIPKVDPNANANATPNSTPNTTVDPNVKTTTTTAKKGAVKSPEQTKKELEQKLAAAQAANKTPEQIRQEKQAAATDVAQKQMAKNPVPSNQTTTGGNNVALTPAQIRQQKLDAAAKAAQGQMAPFSKLPTDQTAVQAGNIRQQKQATATQIAQDQMANNGTFSKLPADQFAKSASNVRQQQQGVATQTAQDQMANNGTFSKLPADQFAKSAANVRQQQQGAATQNAQGEMLPVSKLPADQFGKSATNVRQQQQSTATKTAQDQMAGSGGVQGIKSNVDVNKLQKFDGIVDVSPKIQPPPQVKDAKGNTWTKTSAGWTNGKREIDRQDSTYLAFDDAWREANGATPGNAGVAKTPEQIRQEKQAAATQAAQGQMAGNVTQPADKTKPDNTVKMPKQKKTNPGKNAFGQMAQNLTSNPGKNAFGQMAQNLDKAAESTRFDKLNFLFESIIAEAGEAEAEGVPKKSISQWIIDFFKKFMKGEDITSDPTIMANVIALAKELEKNYKDDKGKTTIPKLANLAWSATHSPGEKSATTPPDDEPPTTNKTLPSNNNTSNNTVNNQSNQKAQTTLAQVKSLLKNLTPKQKQTILTNLQKELAKDDTISFGGKKQDPNDPTTAKMMAMAKQQGKI